MTKQSLVSLAGILALSAGTALATAQPAEDAVQATAETVEELAPKTGLPVGWLAPAVELQNKDGEPVKLAEVYASGPTVVAFYRGGWCPYCTRQLKEWQKFSSEFEDAGVNIVFITPEAVDNVNTSIEKTDTTYTLLSDSDQQAASLFNVIFSLDTSTISKYKGYGIDLNTWNANMEWSLPVPGVFLIDTDGVVRWQHIDEDYTTRANPEKVLEQVAAL